MLPYIWPTVDSMDSNETEVAACEIALLSSAPTCLVPTFGACVHQAALTECLVVLVPYFTTEQIKSVWSGVAQHMAVKVGYRMCCQVLQPSGYA
jgi:hypothetical protein